MIASWNHLKPVKMAEKNISFNAFKKNQASKQVKKRNAVEATVVPNNSSEYVAPLKIKDSCCAQGKETSDQTNATGDGPMPSSTIRCLNCERMAKNFMFLEDMIKTRGMSSSSKKSCHTCLSALNYLQWLNQIIRNVFQNSVKIHSKAQDVKADVVSPRKPIILKPEPAKPVKKIKKPTTRQTKLMKEKITENLKNGLRSHEGLSDKPKIVKKQKRNETNLRSPKAKY